jgi:hypothetical protein
MDTPSDVEQKHSFEEWVQKFDDLINEAEEDGIDVQPQACCCGEGLALARGEDWEQVL